MDKIDMNSKIKYCKIKKINKYNIYFRHFSIYLCVSIYIFILLLHIYMYIYIA